MQATPLYNFAPLLQILLLGALLTALALGWAWRSHAGQGRARLRQALTVATLFLTFDLIVVGAFTRLTDSGLGCPDWPGCYGFTSPVGAHAHIADAQAAMPSGPVTHQKAWIEMLHRYLATGVGGLILLQAMWAWADRLRPGRTGVEPDISLWWPSFTLVWVLLQGLFGALTVTMKLFPAIVSLHLLGAYGLLALLVLQVSLRSRLLGGGLQMNSLSAHVRALVWIGMGALLLQASAGAWVSTNYAVLACAEFPKCQGAWWPAMDFATGLELWRPLGETAAGEILSFQALTAIHMLHRMLAVLAFSVLGTVVYVLSKAGVMRRERRLLLALLVLQFLSGLSNVVLGWPMLAALLHTAGAGAMVAVLTWMLAQSAAPSTELQTQRKKS